MGLPQKWWFFCWKIPFQWMIWGGPQFIDTSISKESLKLTGIHRVWNWEKGHFPFPYNELPERILPFRTADYQRKLRKFGPPVGGDHPFNMWFSTLQTNSRWVAGIQRSRSSFWARQKRGGGAVSTIGFPLQNDQSNSNDGWSRMEVSCWYPKSSKSCSWLSIG